MKNWHRILIIFLITAAVGGGYLLYVFKQREKPGEVPQQDASQALSQDELAVVRAFSPQHFDDLARMEGTRVWMKSGYAMPYFPYAAGKVDFTRREGLIAPDQQMDIKKVIKAAAPEKVDDGLEHGTRQALVTFAIPGQEGMFATAIGAMQGDQEQYFPDQLFYYDDPHTIYDHWGKDVWAAVDAHQVKPGMSELETRMSIGSKLQSGGQKEGDRTVTYDENGKHWTITYVGNRATEIKSE